MILRKQAEEYFRQISERKRNPVKPATLSAYRSYIDTWILPELGDLQLAKIENGTVKKLVTKLSQNDLKPATIQGILNVIKQIVKSAVDLNGNYIYPRTWNNDFLDAPIVDPKSQNAPTIDSKHVSEAIRQSPRQYKVLYALLAGTGLRINEALSLTVFPRPEGSYYDKDKSMIVIKTALYHGKEQTPKTPAGIREIDLDPNLNVYLSTIPQNCQGYMFYNNLNKPMRLATAYAEANKRNIPGFHSFRRFRITHLEKQSVPKGLVDFWAGHTGKDVHDRYVKIGQEIQARKDWAVKAGLGFELPVYQ